MALYPRQYPVLPDLVITAVTAEKYVDQTLFDSQDECEKQTSQEICGNDRDYAKPND